MSVKRSGTPGQILYEMCFNLLKNGNEVYYTIFKALLVKIMLCSKLHGKKCFKLKHISYQVRGRARAAVRAAPQTLNHKPGTLNAAPQTSRRGIGDCACPGEGRRAVGREWEGGAAGGRGGEG